MLRRSVAELADQGIYPRELILDAFHTCSTWLSFICCLFAVDYEVLLHLRVLFHFHAVIIVATSLSMYTQMPHIQAVHILLLCNICSHL